MNVQESIKRILREEGFIPIPIKRRVSPEAIEDAFELALVLNALSMENPNSVIYKEKNPTLWIFAKFVIDDMVTHIEQEIFNDSNRIYFSDNDEDYESYHEKIRKPLLRHYGKRIKEKYDEVMSSNDGEMIQESIRRILREETEVPLFIRRRFNHKDLDQLINNVEDAILRYGDDKHIDDVIYDEVREFITEFVDYEDWHNMNDNKYWDTWLKYETPLVNYVKTKLNMI